jgi:RsiW-degrading membrane proteinase PrsW (M82 family)
MTFDLSSVADALKTLALVFATLTIAYAGLVLATSTDPSTREEWKEVIAGVILGLTLLFLAPWIAQQLAGGTYCHA